MLERFFQMARIKIQTASATSSARGGAAFQATPLHSTPRADPMVTAEYFGADKSSIGRGMMALGQGISEAGQYFAERKRKKEALNIGMEYDVYTAQMEEEMARLSLKENLSAESRAILLQEHAEAYEERIISKIQGKELRDEYEAKGRVLTSKINAAMLPVEARAIAKETEDGWHVKNASFDKKLQTSDDLIGTVADYIADTDKYAKDRNIPIDKLRKYQDAFVKNSIIVATDRGDYDAAEGLIKYSIDKMLLNAGEAKASRELIEASKNAQGLLKPNQKSQIKKSINSISRKYDKMLKGSPHSYKFVFISI
jgi:hypothetical protein